MTVFLTSSPSGPLDGSRPVNGLDRMNGFVENLKERWRENARCLMITASPDAYGQNDEMTCFFERAVKKAGLSVAEFQLWDGRTADLSGKDLHAYDVVFLGGGHVPTQNQFFRRICLREKLQGYEGIVIGISAGTMNSADVVYAQPELPGESVNPEYVRWMEGLNLTKTQILPHYQMVKDYDLDGRRLYEDITCEDSMGHEFLVLTDGSYLLAEHGTETVFGEAYAMADGRLRQVCATDQKVVWKR